MAHQMTISVDNPSVLRTLRSLFKSMDGVSIIAQPRVRKKTVAKTEEPDMTKEDILESIDSAFKELKLNLDGKLEFKTLEEALDEL